MLHSRGPEFLRNKRVYERKYLNQLHMVRVLFCEKNRYWLDVYGCVYECVNLSAHMGLHGAKCISSWVCLKTLLWRRPLNDNAQRLGNSRNFKFLATKLLQWQHQCETATLKTWCSEIIFWGVLFRYKKKKKKSALEPLSTLARVLVGSTLSCSGQYFS